MDHLEKAKDAIGDRDSYWAMTHAAIAQAEALQRIAVAMERNSGDKQDATLPQGKETTSELLGYTIVEWGSEKDGYCFRISGADLICDITGHGYMTPLFAYEVAMGIVCKHLPAKE